MQDGAVVGEADQAAVKCGVPEDRERQAVVYVEPQGVDFTFGPRHSVRCAQRGIGVDLFRHIRDHRSFVYPKC